MILHQKDQESNHIHGKLSAYLKVTYVILTTIFDFYGRDVV